MGYIKDLRKEVGTRPLLMPGSCVLLFNKQGELLLQLRKDNQCWGLPGGSMELGENLEEVAYRELEEETGLKAKDLKLLRVYSGEEFYYKLPNGDEVYNVTAAYLCNDYSGTLQKQEEEVADLQFFSPFSLPSSLNPPDAPVIKNALVNQEDT
ncbi:NUDIX hydrolase [Pontibacillus salipaludis]|uniref:NUDIX hydrolase n=1 Tax=Pontibacillus salipaludis TaxID=1697394 RepID=UPI001663BD21|nr:NUDIX hydrolase [Pontibacillus salipaludis]